MVNFPDFCLEFLVFKLDFLQTLIEMRIKNRVIKTNIDYCTNRSLIKDQGPVQHVTHIIQFLLHVFQFIGILRVYD